MNCILLVFVVFVVDKLIYGLGRGSATSYETESYSESDYDEESEYDESEDDESDYNERIFLKLNDDHKHGSVDKELIKRFVSEMKAGDPADLFGTNQHFWQSDVYPDLSRRFVPQYPYTEVKDKQPMEEGRLTPKLAPPEIVLAIAKKSAVLEASKPFKPTDEKLEKDILRTGEYWNDVWKESVNPENLLRTANKASKNKNLETINVKVMPGSSLYDLVSKLKEKSTRLLYIINNKQKKK